MHHQRCLPVDFAASYSALADCVERRTDLCEDTLFGDGSSWQPTDVVACAQAQRLWSELPQAEHCAAWVRAQATRALPEPCRQAGDLPDGEPCLRADQCANGRCAELLVGDCGACDAPASADEPCIVDGDCAIEHGCHEGVCVLFGGVVGALAPCLPDLGTDAEGRCVSRLGAGGACDPSADECARWPEELACSALTATCEPVRLVGRDEPCGNLAAEGPARCAFGLGCHLDHLAGPHCVDLVSDGHSCALNVQGDVGEWLGGPCFAPASCTNFHCGLGEVAACTGVHAP